MIWSVIRKKLEKNLRTTECAMEQNMIAVTLRDRKATNWHEQQTVAAHISVDNKGQ